MMNTPHFAPPTIPASRADAPSSRLRVVAAVALVLTGHGAVLGWLHARHATPPSDRLPPAVVQASLISPDPTPAAQPRLEPPPAPPPPQERPRARPTPPRAEPAPALSPTTVPSEKVATPTAAAPAAPPAIAAVPPTPAPAGAPAVRTPVAPAADAPPPRIEQPSASAAYLNNPPPSYPALSRRLGEEGKVVLRVRIEPDGTASAAEIRTSSGYDRLDQTALETVLRWKYVPGTRNGVPEAMWFLIPIQFVLE